MSNWETAGDECGLESGMKGIIKAEGRRCLRRRRGRCYVLVVWMVVVVVGGLLK